MSDFKFIIKTALRDSRKNTGRLFMFMSSIILGISALVAINSFNYNLVRDIDEQSKSLLGADLVINGNRALTPELKVIADSIPGERATEQELFSMSYIPKTKETQFVRIKAVKGNFPFYGKIQTEPEDFAQKYQQDAMALVDDGMMLEHDLNIGDSIRLGKKGFVIGARLKSMFGSVSLGSSFAPAVYIGQDYMEETDLIKAGSMVDYSYYYRLPENMNGEEWENNHERQKKFRDESFRVTSIEDQKENLDEAFSNLNNFLNLIALVSLILGCIGVASSVFIYIKSKIPSIAIFRCIGMKGIQAFKVYFFQIFILGSIAVLIGAAIGSMIQIVMPLVLADLLPYQVELEISWMAIAEGIVIGLIMTSLFALIPLIGIRRISPLRTLRSSFEEDIAKRDPVQWIFYGAILVFMILFLWNLTNDFKAAIIFTIGLIVAFLLLYGVASLIMYLLRSYFPKSFSFVARQGMSNLFRPNNQTRTLIVSIGLGTAILTLLFIIQGLLLNNVDAMDAGNQPNVILYGIETNQKDSLAKITKKHDLPLIQQVPIVTMRLSAWQGKTKAEWMADTSRTASRWAINREARVSYRDTLADDEKLLEGKLRKFVSGDSIFISLSARYAEALDVGIGDALEWNVQGAILKTFVGSIREIQFRSMRTRFFILFPNGVLEKAPQFHVLVSKSPDNNSLADYRREVVRTFPNISVVDLGSILLTLNEILSKISYVIKFMAAFSILTGLIVLISSLLLSKYQRIRESILLRTIGASRFQILTINGIEYAILGALSAATGIFIALVGSYLIATQQLDLDYDIRWAPIFLIFLFIIFLTLVIGILNSKDVVQKSPLEVLRKELN